MRFQRSTLFEFCLFPISASGFSMTSPSSSTTGNPLPNLPLPPPILSDEKGTWAYDTMSRRVDEEILQRTYAENEEEFNSPGFEEALENFNALRAELQNAANTKLRHLQDLTPEEEKSEERVREYNEWKEILGPHVEAGDTWLTAPWLTTEFYAYRRLIEATNYFDKTNPATYMYDVFAKAKRAGLETSVASAENVMDKIEALPASREGAGIAAAFSLWGNKMDLSIWPADENLLADDVFASILDAAEENLLADDVESLTNYCQKLKDNGGGSVDIVVDNAGFELIMDLALADYLISSGIATEIRFQLKKHPTFVSDALEKDLIEHVKYYAKLDSKYPNAKRAGSRWTKYLSEGKWICSENYFWVQPCPMWEMPADLRNDMKTRCDLAFIKGDANYRRLLGDRYWDLSAPFQDVVGCYFPCPVCALRTLKAELGCGMAAEQVERAKSLDDNWMTNGRFGVVQFSLGAEK